MLRFPLALVLLFTLALVISPSQEPKQLPKWSADEARKLLEKYPDDPYLRYVYYQSDLRQHQRTNDTNFNRGFFNTGRPQATSFDTFSGGLAVEESLQLQAMQSQQANNFNPANAEAGNGKKVAISTLHGPKIESHPWKKMLEGRKRSVSAMSLYVPEDNYFLEFRSASKLLETLKTADLWSGHLFAQVMGSARSDDLEIKLKKQLGITGIPPALIDSIGLKSIAITGSDLYLSEGSDVTLLVQGENLVAAQQFLGEAAGAGIQKSKGMYQTIEYRLTTSADKSIHYYACEPKADLHVRSNSLLGLARVLSCVLGKDEQGRAATPLGATDEFQYIRSIYTLNAVEEDGFIYLSDPFIRRILGPEVKLKQSQRYKVRTLQKMIERAALMYRSETGKNPKTLEELATAKCAPGIFGTGNLACPLGGTFTLSDDGMSATHSILGPTTTYLPLLELPLTEVTQNEAKQYQNFVVAYSNYWQTFFDPIALRVQLTKEKYRLETIVLPLINNSIYNQLVETIGGETSNLGSFPYYPKTAYSFAGHINKGAIFSEESSELKGLRRDAGHLWELNNESHQVRTNYDYPKRAITDANGKPLLSWRVAILPRIGEMDLYKEFKLDEPWDSENNKKLIPRMPVEFQSANTSPDHGGRTRHQAVVGNMGLFSKDGKSHLLQTGGGWSKHLSKVTFVRTTPERAVVWTKPEDVELNTPEAVAGLVEKGQQEFLAVTADGESYLFKKQLTQEEVAGLFSLDVVWKSGIRTVTKEIPVPRVPSWLESIPLDRNSLRNFLMKGIEDQIYFQVLDAGQPISLQMNGLIGPKFDLLNNSRFGSGQESMLIYLLLQSMTNPVCVHVPVKDAKIADEFLCSLETYFREKVDYYSIRPETYITQVENVPVRVLTIKLFDFVVRVAYARVGDWLIVTNQTSNLPELIRYYQEHSYVKSKNVPKKTMAHGQLRIHQMNWNMLLPQQRLGWAELDRQACEKNQFQFALMARSYPELVRPGEAVSPLLLQKLRSHYGSRPFCPEGGNYSMHSAGRCDCSIHGNGEHGPRQPLQPSERSSTQQALIGIKNVTATLSFLEDGLHAVVEIERK